MTSDKILFSANYTRQLQRTFKMECFDFIRDTYMPERRDNPALKALMIKPAAGRGNNASQLLSMQEAGNMAALMANANLNDINNDIRRSNR